MQGLVKDKLFWQLLACSLAGMLALHAHAGASDSAVDANLHVDVAAVVEDGELIPVDGLTSSGQPDAAAFKVFADAGYVAVIDLRGEREDRGLDEQQIVEDLGLAYVSLPTSGRDGISFDQARALDDVLGQYDGAVLVHCGSGNRVGALLALRESMQGATDADALAYGKSAGLTRLEPVVRERLDEDN